MGCIEYYIIYNFLLCRYFLCLSILFYIFFVFLKKVLTLWLSSGILMGLLQKEVGDIHWNLQCLSAKIKYFEKNVKKCKKVVDNVNYSWYIIWANPKMRFDWSLKTK